MPAAKKPAARRAKKPAAARSTKPAGKRKPKAAKKAGPKRPRSAYIWFGVKERPAIRKAHPSWGMAEIGRELGKLWR